MRTTCRTARESSPCLSPVVTSRKSRRLMKITALIFSLVFLASTACAQSKEVETKYTDYGFAVTLPSDVTLAHEHATDGKDSTGAPTTEDNFTSKDNDYMIVVVGYTKPLVATS